VFGQSVKKAPGPDRLVFKAIRLLWECDTPRIIGIVKTSFSLGIHPQASKEAKGLVIPKPNKPDYGVAKAYRVSTLLHCLGKVVEKVAANGKQRSVSVMGCYMMDSLDAERKGQQ